MSRPTITLLGALSLSAAMILGFAMSDTSHGSDSSSRVLRHIVMYKFKDGLAADKLQEVIDAFAGLPKKIPTIVDFEAGTNVSPEGKSEGFTHVFVVTFRTEKDRDNYLVDPAHKDYVNVVKDRREKVIVFDYWTAP